MRRRAKHRYLQMRCKTEPAADGNEPLRRIILIPTKSVPEIGRELVVEIVVAFAKCNHRSNHMITRGMLVIEWSLSKPVCQGVDTKRRVVDEDKTGSTSIYVAPTEITPK